MGDPIPSLGIIPSRRVLHRQILSCALQNLEQELGLGQGNGRGVDLLCQTQVGVLEAALVLDDRKRVELHIDLVVEKAVIAAAQRRRTTAVAIQLQMLAALRLTRLLQRLKLLGAPRKLADALKQLDVAVNVLEQWNRFFQRAKVRNIGDLLRV